MLRSRVPDRIGYTSFANTPALNLFTGEQVGLGLLAAGREGKRVARAAAGRRREQLAIARRGQVDLANDAAERLAEVAGPGLRRGPHREAGVARRRPVAAAGATARRHDGQHARREL